MFLFQGKASERPLRDQVVLDPALYRVTQIADLDLSSYLAADDGVTFRHERDTHLRKKL